MINAWHLLWIIPLTVWHTFVCTLLLVTGDAPGGDMYDC